MTQPKVKIERRRDGVVVDITRVVDGCPEFLCVVCECWTPNSDGGDSDERFEGAERMCSGCWSGANDQLAVEAGDHGIIISDEGEE